MSLLDLPETLLQRAAQKLLSDSGRVWTCTNGDPVQILAPGIVNPHEGPDFTHIAVLYQGCVRIGTAEFHTYSSSWFDHGHAKDARYDDVMMHIVLVDDKPADSCMWTLVLPHSDMGLALHGLGQQRDHDASNVDEIQRSAILRLNRATAYARSAIGRVGSVDALRVMTSQWFDRLASKRRHPMPEDLVLGVRAIIISSPLGRLATQICDYEPEQILDAIDRAERERIFTEGAALRREIVVNVILPICCALAGDAQRIALFQWYWSVRAVHPYGLLTRRFPNQDQTYVWQQQGMLEWLRRYG